MLGTLNMLGLAKRVKARLLFTSTSEIYGDPEVHPQPESYWGHVNCIGPRACYDEGKRVGETLCYEYRRLGVSVRVARIFNTFGPRMDPDDGRVVSNFIKQALRGDDLSIYGDGSQTRSFQYVSDLVQGLVALMNCDSIDDVKDGVVPVNLGNQEEFTIKEVSLLLSLCCIVLRLSSFALQFAEYVRALVNPSAKIIYTPATTDDPKQRKPNNARAAELLHWKPKTRVKSGLERTVLYFKHELGLATAADAATPTIWIPDIVDRLPVEYLTA
jgi:UDP-glucuronate decarboxylase